MKKILIIDDDSDILQLYGIALDGEGFNIVTADGGHDGIAQAKNEHPDLILLDLMMTDMSGIQVLEVLKSEATTKDIPTVMFTNYSDEKYVKEAMSHGAVKYIVKSNYDPDDIVKELYKLLNLPPKEKEPDS